MSFGSSFARAVVPAALVATAAGPDHWGDAGTDSSVPRVALVDDYVEASIELRLD